MVLTDRMQGSIRAQAASSIAGRAAPAVALSVEPHQAQAAVLACVLGSSRHPQQSKKAAAVPGHLFSTDHTDLIRLRIHHAVLHARVPHSHLSRDLFRRNQSHRELSHAGHRQHLNRLHTAQSARRTVQRGQSCCFNEVRGLQVAAVLRR